MGEREQDASGPSRKRQSSSHSPQDLSERNSGRADIKRRIVKNRHIRRTNNDDMDNSVDDVESRASHPHSRTVSPDNINPTALRILREVDTTPSRSKSRSPRNQRQKQIPTGPSLKPLPRSKLAPSRSAHPPLLPCRSVYSYTRLNHIEEGTYGVVFRAKCNETKQIFALKKLKLEEEKSGFPITSLREVMALMLAGEHPNVVGIREIVVGETLNQIFIVMPFIEHDLKTLLADMPNPFLQSEIKTIMLQLLSGVEFCHANWILHRDLKTSNLLFTNRGQLRIADFGLARKFGDPLGEMTQLVVTLWYRAPELLLGSKEYDKAIDMWSVGCIFGELMAGEAILQGRGEIDQISKVFNLLGQPSDDVWPGYSKLPLVQKINPIGPPFSVLRGRFKQLSSNGHYLLASLLMYDPQRRISAEEALKHPYFDENPLPKHPDLFPSFPSQAAGERKHRAIKSPPAPVAHRDVSEDKDDIMDLESFV